MDAEAEVVVDSDGSDEEEGRGKVVVVGGTVSVVVAGISSITLYVFINKIRKDGEGRKGVKKGREEKRRGDKRGGRDIRVFLSVHLHLCNVEVGCRWSGGVLFLLFAFFLFVFFLYVCFESGGCWRRGRRGYRGRGGRSRGR